ncbi:hypothetical protein [Lacinutrix sp. MedPE-SW]|uniref:hypothetical protein n=1 Tax=Lacinutrix sp. MedPE-SW TaxID=1860087 RepID=UPI00091472D9|nr:hypothetical protein [Lacinutrix sp. MedPE-SW]OIQ22826.1 MAG: hypothetical protein BM549_07015 [Lacinutrix sp. MedPE-SW]
MNKLIYILLVLFFTRTYSQEVTIEGYAFNTFASKKDRKVSVTINDTINKLLEAENYEALREFGENKTNWKKYTTTTNRKGKFKIKAKLNDSLTFTSKKHKTQHYLVSDLFKNEEIKISLKRIDCNDYKCNEEPKLLIFSGSKIDLKKAKYNYCTSNLMNSEWIAKYTVDSLHHGDYTDKNITFLISLHASTPSFKENENRLVYLYNFCNNYKDIKISDPIYKTKNGNWATNYSNFFLNKIPKELRPEPTKIDFLEPVVINFHESWDEEYISKRWYEPFYTIKGRTAIANYGFYIEEAIKIKLAFMKKYY